jgi:alkylation response protein AidB-like acyl-CoA dehydrogenase
MDNYLLADITTLAEQFATDRRQRQQRRHLESADFEAIAATGYTKLAVPTDAGGQFESISETARTICTALRTLARGDSSVALVSAMHPAVLSYWLTVPEDDITDVDAWQQQCDAMFRGVLDGDWWGTITSEPGSGGDVARTRTVADPTGEPLQYEITGQKHFGSGSGAMTHMVTTAVPEGEDAPDWFVVRTRDVLWDGSEGLSLIAEWDGHGMVATQSHAMSFERFPALRIACPGHLADVAARTGGFIGGLFTAVIAGIVDVAIDTAREKLGGKELSAYEQVEWTRAKTEHWLVSQAFEGMLRAIETQVDSRAEVLLGKTAIAELSETIMTRLCRTIGGGTFSRSSPFGYWFEDVRALGFLRPPWALAFETLGKE